MYQIYKKTQLFLQFFMDFSAFFAILKAALRISMANFMEKPVTLTELTKLTSDEEVASYHTSRLSALMRKLGDRVVREEVKGKAYFSIA